MANGQYRTELKTEVEKKKIESLKQIEVEMRSGPGDCFLGVRAVIGFFE